MSRIKTQTKDRIRKAWHQCIEKLIPWTGRKWSERCKLWYIFLTNNWIIPYLPCRYVRLRVFERKACYSPLEMQTLCNCVLATGTQQNINTAIAEVGVFRGGTARVISDMAEGRAVLLFDTFEGLPEPINGVDSKAFGMGDYTERNIAKVAKYVGDRPFIIPGVFPASANEAFGMLMEGINTQFSFVHLDVDLYKGTKDALDFFATRMVKGGIILVHDYTCSEGVSMAVREFALSHSPLKHTFVFLLLQVEGGTQAMLISLGR